MLEESVGGDINIGFQSGNKFGLFEVELKAG